MNKYSRLEPPAQLLDWASMVLQEDGKSLEDVLISLNFAILGIEQKEGEKKNLFALFKENCPPPSDSLSFCQAILEFRSVHLSACPSVCLPVCPPVRLSACPPGRPLACLSVRLSILACTCKCILASRDYLVGIQILGYALLLAAMNCNDDRRGAVMAQMMALNRLMQQEDALGARYNDW